MSVSVDFIANDTPATIGAAAAKLFSNDDYREAFLAVAYGVHSGINEFGGTPTVQNFIARGGRLRTVFDIDRHFTDPDLIDEFSTLPGDVECRLYAPRILGESRDRHHPAFHAKVYYFANRSRAAAIIGSCNLSVGGLRMNHEAALRIVGSRSTPVFQDVARYLTAIWDHEAVIAVDTYERFREAYRHAYQSARDRSLRPGVPDESPLLQINDDLDGLRNVLHRDQENRHREQVAYLSGLIAGGCREVDRHAREVVIELRRGLLNKGKRGEGRVFFAGVSEHDWVLADCVRRDAERIQLHVRNSMAPGDTVECVRRGDYTYRFVLRFAEHSSRWAALRPWRGLGRHQWPTHLSMDDPIARHAFVQGYMDLRTRVAETDRIPNSFLRVAVSVGRDESPEFAERLRDAMTADLACDPGSVNLLQGESRARETLIRINAHVIPSNFLASPWQRVVVDDFRRYNEKLID